MKGWSQEDGSAGEGTCLQVWQLEFHPQERTNIYKSSSGFHTCSAACMSLHTCTCIDINTHTHSQANKIKYVYPIQSVIPTWTSMTGASSFPSSPKEPTLCPFCHLTSSRHRLCQLLHAVQLWLVFQGWDVIWFLLALGRTSQDGLQVQSPPLARTLRDLVWVSGQKLSSHGRHLFSGFKLIPQSVSAWGEVGPVGSDQKSHCLMRSHRLSVKASLRQPPRSVFSSRWLPFKMWRFQTTGHKARDN